MIAPYTYLRPIPCPGEADASQPEVLCSSPARRPRARRLFSLVGWLGLATYACGMPAAIWVWLS